MRFHERPLQIRITTAAQDLSIVITIQGQFDPRGCDRRIRMCMSPMAAARALAWRDCRRPPHVCMERVTAGVRARAGVRGRAVAVT